MFGQIRVRRHRKAVGGGSGRSLLENRRREIPKLTALQQRELGVESPGQHPVTIPRTARASQSLKNKINLGEKYPAHQPLHQ